MLETKKVYAVIGAAGSGKRMGASLPKQFLKIGGRTILQITVEKFLQLAEVDQVIVVTSAEYLSYCNTLFEHAIGEGRLVTVTGGAERQDSVSCGIRKLREFGASDQDIVLIHDGVRPFVSDALIRCTAEETERYEAVIPAVQPKDTIRHEKEGTLTRSQLWCVQTPQGFRLSLIERALEAAVKDGFYGTDDASLVERLGRPVRIIPGEMTNIKITTPEDLPVENRIGTGFDVHRLVEGRSLILGGVDIPYEKGLLGHSDADVLIHALMDALLGAAAKGDIGKLFPDSDDAYKGISSILLLEKVAQVLSRDGYRLGNADMTLICQKPKLAPYIEEMRQNIASALAVDADKISIKATTTEKLGFTGRGEGIAAEAVCLLNR